MRQLQASAVLVLSGSARFRTVELGVSADDLVEVVRGLATSGKLIVGDREGWKEGARVKLAGEDESLGIAAPAADRKKTGT